MQESFIINLVEANKKSFAFSIFVGNITNRALQMKEMMDRNNINKYFIFKFKYS